MDEYFVALCDTGGQRLTTHPFVPSCAEFPLAAGVAVLTCSLPSPPPPHRLKKQLTFVLTDAPVVRAKLVATYADRSASVSNPAVPAVGDAVRVHSF